MSFDNFDLSKLQSLFKLMEDNGCTEICIGDLTIKKSILNQTAPPKKEEDVNSNQDELFAHLPSYTRFIERV